MTNKFEKPGKTSPDAAIEALSMALLMGMEIIC